MSVDGPNGNAPRAAIGGAHPAILPCQKVRRQTERDFYEFIGSWAVEQAMLVHVGRNGMR